jgi:hypothetical protein
VGEVPPGSSHCATALGPTPICRASMAWLTLASRRARRMRSGRQPAGPGAGSRNPIRSTCTPTRKCAPTHRHAESRAKPPRQRKCRRRHGLRVAAARAWRPADAGQRALCVRSSALRRVSSMVPRWVAP